MSKHLTTAAPAALLPWLLKSAVGKNKSAKIGLEMGNEETDSRYRFQKLWVRVGQGCKAVFKNLF